MSKVNRILLLLLTFVIALGLGACGAPAKDVTPYSPPAGTAPTEPPSQADKIAEGVYLFDKKTPDNRTVTCAVYIYKNVDCDWAHAK